NPFVGGVVAEALSVTTPAIAPVARSIAPMQLAGTLAMPAAVPAPVALNWPFAGLNWPDTVIHLPPATPVNVMMFVVLSSSTSITVIVVRSEEHTSELQSQSKIVCRLLLEQKKLNQAW